MPPTPADKAAAAAARPFIDAIDSRIVPEFFYYVTRFLARRTFRRVWLQNDYGSGKALQNRSTLFIGNHNAWWDALTPLLLNQKLLRQTPRAVMEWEQVDRYPFFRRIGCYSIDRKDPRSALGSLRYGIDWLNNGTARNLWLYPEGKITNPVLPDSPFESGVGWMLPQLDSHVDLVPIIQHHHMMHHPKPDLFLWLGTPLKPDTLGSNKKEITASLQRHITSMKLTLAEKAAPKEPDFRRLV
ncbi:1-acyl-sn-glycerol-3-phosphate acyltransferase [Cyclonatronum proteinivorum]|uniref:1-acyl-sn-glycerol-3-phosphate acyltransferase n=1 Tax=Cyclonatronum proteinivorum TaxID=1457365 RepID=A0A345UL39_9BACT|nr:lysophospholipid acyltransferase family protein [Cyclonatronum proteinivorum]AXJ01191.1 1-acyl-sn-glycerol-3-phosphate acyltransferase [Cyclonatronum proteinivorum]